MKDTTRAVDDHGTSHSKTSGNIEETVKSLSDAGAALRQVRKDSLDAGDGTKDLEVKMAKLRNAWSQFDQLLRNGELSKGQARRGLKEYASEFSNVSQELRTGSDEWIRWGEEADKVTKKLKSSDLSSTGGFIGSLQRKDVGGVLENIGARFDDLGIRITGVSSFLRGFFELAKIGFSQQLLTGVASLAGSFVSLASAAAQAGAVLGGAFISGLGQAIPMLSIVAASVERFKSILQAVSVTGQIEQQLFYDPTQKQRTELQNASQLISAQQQLSNSYVQLYESQQRVRDSQIALTEARVDAVRNIENLTLAEKNARLAAEGANLSLSESRRQLAIAIQRGDTAGLAQAELAVRQAELSKEKADVEVPRAVRDARLARQRGVEGAPTVIGAEEGLASARQGVVQAGQAAEAARRQEQITKLAQAARSSHETSQESQLKYLEKGMSPIEKELVKSLVAIQKQLKLPDSPLKKIADYVVEPFANAVKRIKVLLEDKSFLGPLDDLAKSMGSGLGKIEQTIFGGAGTKFFEDMAKLAATNVPIIIDSLEHLIHIFEHIAKAAGPAFTKLSEDWDKFWAAIDTKQHSKEGFESLEKFFTNSVKFAEGFVTLGKAVTDLFLAIGHDAAPQGLQTVTTFAQTIEKATQWVQSHGPEVTKFFREAREGLSLIGEMLFGIGKSIIEVFSLSSLQAFNGFLQQIILPALRDVVNVLGFLTRLILKVVDAIPGGKATFEAFAGLLLSIEILGKAAGPVIKVIELMKTLRIVTIAAMAGFEAYKGTWFLDIGTGISAAITKFKLLKGAALDTAATIETTSAAETASISGITAAESGAVAGEAALGAGAGGAGLLGGAAGIAGKVALPIGAVFAASQLAEAGQQTGASGLPTGDTSFGGQLSRYEGKEFGDLRNLQIGKFVGGILGTSNDESKPELTLRKFGNEVEKLKKHLLTLPASKLQEIQNEAEALAKDPSLNKFRGSIEKVAVEFNPSEIAAKKWSENIKEYLEKLSPAAQNVAKSFESISISTGAIWKNIKNVVKENIENIRENLGLNSKQGKEALAANFGEAQVKIEESMAKGGTSTKIGMERIKKLVSEALSKYGVKPGEINSFAQHSNKSQTHSGQEAESLHAAGFAAGGYIGAQPGGKIARVGEGGHDEVVLTTDPRYAKKQKQLLGQYFSRAPHMATGGFVADPGTNFTVNQEPKIVTELRKLGEYLHTTIYGISGYRSPSHSVEVGGFADDPHTRGEAADVGVGSNTLESASRLTASILAKFDLYRPFYPASAHEINHVQLIPGTVGGIVGSLGGGSSGGGSSSFASLTSAPELKAPKIKGGGAVGQVVQGALNLATKAANIYLSKASGMKEGMGAVLGAVHLSGGSVGAQVMNFFKSRVGRFGAAGMVGNFQQESSLDPNAPEGGLDQGQGARDYSSLPLSGQLGGIWKELLGPESGTLSLLRRAKTAAQAARIFSERFERPSIPDLSNRERYAEEALRSYAIGGVAPWGGKPVPAILHEGERVLNPSQYHETARMAGTSAGGLDSHLGFTNTPRQSFAAGGPIILGHTTQPSTGSFSLPLVEPELGSLGYILKIFKEINKGFKKLGKFKNEQYIEKAVSYIQEIVIAQNGFLAKLQEGREFFKAKLARVSVSKEYTQKGGKVQLGSLGQVGIDAQNISNLSEEAKILGGERQVMTTTMSKIKQDMKKAEKIKDPKKRKEALNALKTATDELRIKQKELGEVISQNIEARYQAETQRIQDEVSKVNAVYQTVSQEKTGEVSSAQALGNLGQVGGIEQQIKSAAESQLNVLAPLLQQAEAVGNTELAATIKQEMIGLKQTITSAVVETISNAQTQIQREAGLAESKTGMLESLSKTAAASGKYNYAGQLEKEALENKQTSLLSTRAAEEQLLAKAAAEGDTTAIISLTEELGKNTSEIEENNLALKENVVVTRELVINQIEQTGQFKKGIYGAAIQGLETIGKTTGFTNVPAMISAAKGEGAALGTERTELEKQAGTMGLGVEGMSPAEILSFLASPEGQAKLSQLESKEDKGEKEQMYKIVQALEGNATATLQNTEKLAELNGSLNQPQTFTTAAFSSFRSAIFTGMGQLQPQYQAALPPGSAPTGLPSYGTNAPGARTTNVGPINLTHPVEVVDPHLLGEQLAYHISTAPVI